MPLTDAIAAIIRSLRRGRGPRLAAMVSATKVPYLAAASPSNGRGSKSATAAPSFSIRAARTAWSLAMATPCCNSANVTAVSSGVRGRASGLSTSRSITPRGTCGGRLSLTTQVPTGPRSRHDRFRIRSDPRVQVYVPEGVVPPRLEHRVPQRALVPESAPLGDTAGRVVAEGVAQFEAV